MAVPPRRGHDGRATEDTFMTRKVLYLTAGLLATLLCAAGAFGADQRFIP